MKYGIHSDTRSRAITQRLACSRCHKRGGMALKLSYTLDENLRMVDLRLLCGTCRTSLRYQPVYFDRGERMEAA